MPRHQASMNQHIFNVSNAARLALPNCGSNKKRKYAKAKSKLGINWTFKDLHTYRWAVENSMWKFNGHGCREAWHRQLWALFFWWWFSDRWFGARFHSYATRLFYLIFRVEWKMAAKGKTRKHILYNFFFFGKLNYLEIWYIDKPALDG